MSEAKESTKKGKALLIVESPAKSKTIKKILGDSFQIEASYGHVRNLPTNTLGFDVNNGFKPTFEIIPEKRAVVKKLNDLAKKADKVYLASDPDREGEAIAWHVRQLLDVPENKIFRIEFNEITPKAVKYAVENSRTIDMDMVQAQQTRQILDKLVGYKLSPILWQKLGNKHLSAGRVQSVALRMICEREEEIEAFVPVEYWSISADLTNPAGLMFSAELTKCKDKKIEINNKEEADRIVQYLQNPSTSYEVTKVTNKDTKRKPTAPFITSTLQREASSKLGYGVERTMQIAQKLYEGIELESGAVGLITYMRTDSVRISDDAQNAAKDFIIKNYGEKYYPETPNVYVKGKQNVQDAHEAIRPSYPERTPDSIKQYLAPEQYKLYKLIWNKFMSSQMANAVVANKTVEISAGDYTLRTGTSKITFDGFLKLYNDSEEDDADMANKMPDLNKGDKCELKKVNPKQHFTQPPPRYSEATLVKALEEYGIGRPSTYASIITKIQTRRYVEKKDKALFPTLLGRTVSKQLVAQFPEIMDYKFTAGMETKLDNIAEKKLIWNKVLQGFYDRFMPTVLEAVKDTGRITIETKVVCPNCGRPMALRTSKTGQQFLGCTGYPECKTILSMNVLAEMEQSGGTQPSNKPQELEEKCAKCGGALVLKSGPYGKYTECMNCGERKPYHRSTGVKCPKCGEGVIEEKKSKKGLIFFGCSKYPDCDFVLWNEPTGDVCPECGALLVKRETQKGTIISCSNRSCIHKQQLIPKEVDDGGENA